MKTGCRYIVTLQTPPSVDEADGVRRLRAMLKRLGRGYGLRCVEVRRDESRMPNADGEYSYPIQAEENF